VLGTFRHWLNQRCYDLKPTLIVFEAPYVPKPNSPQPMNVLTLRRLMGICATVEACAWELRIPCREATPLDIARFFLNTTKLRRVEKKAATIEMCKTYGWFLDENTDAADALALWAMAECHIAPDAARRRGSGPLFIPQATAPPVVTDQGRSLFPPSDEGVRHHGRLAH
jgi:hypothetical protein